MKPYLYLALVSLFGAMMFVGIYLVEPFNIIQGLGVVMFALGLIGAPIAVVLFLTDDD